MEKFDYFGFEAYNFKFDGLNAKIIKPNVKPNGKWVYKTEYFTAFPETQNEFLNRGYHLAYNENFTRWAPDSDLVRKGEFIKYISKEFGLSEKCIPIGMSCGGLYACKTAAMFPELIDVLYLDAPVMNLLSCPCDSGVGSSGLFDEYYRVMKISKSELLSYRDNPIDKMDILLKNDIPVVLVAGGSDVVVPYEENGAILEKYYKENGGRISVHIKPECGHHPHGLDDVKLIVDEIEKFSSENVK
ncbi:MAG: alpha/beta hydrolase [Clostridiales bacterium]|nr:alpha/beta hydrolase [Clostridiales bacterium]